jgi:hypothetical protein
VIRLVRAPRGAGTRASTPDQTTPWRLTDFGRLLRFEVPAVIAIVACFVGARQTETWGNQLYWVVGAMAALLLAGAGWTTWLLVGARSLRHRQRRLADLSSGLVPAHEPTFRADVVVTKSNMTHFHRPDCLLARGRAVTKAPPEDLLAQGVTPCGVCLG